MSSKTILVMGTGTIGEPLIGLLARHKTELGFSDVIFHKRTPTPEDTPKIKRLIDGGARLATDASATAEFSKQMGLQPSLTAEQALERAEAIRRASVAGRIRDFPCSSTTTHSVPGTTPSCWSAG